MGCGLWVVGCGLWAVEKVEKVEEWTVKLAVELAVEKSEL